ncbi:MAG: hypothetical protein ABF242_05865 [Flavobacteriales bacterium]
MKNLKTKMVLTSAAAILTVFACKKDTQTFDQTISSGGNGSSTELSSFFQTNKQNLIQNFSINSVAPTLITGNSGTSLQFYPNSFETQSGASVSGMVDIELIEIFDKSDMILADVLTLGRSSSGQIDPLISGGEFYVNATQNGSALKLKTGVSYAVNVPAPNGVNPNMGIFYGDESNDTLIWDEADSARIQGNGQTTGGGGSYYCFFDSLQWINCDYFYNDPNPKTNVRAIIPAGLSNLTCKVFISFNGLNSVTGFYGFSGGYLNTYSPYKIPVTQGINLIAIASIGGVPHYSITPATVTNNIIVTINPLAPSSAAAIKTAINALP